MLRNIDQNIWVAEQPFQYLELNVGTRMTIIRLEDNDLAVISPLDVNDTMAEDINKIGDVQHIIAPPLDHHLFIPSFKVRYPKATLGATPGLKLKKLDRN